MKKTKLVRFVESLILLPITTMSTMSTVPAVPVTQALNIVGSPQSVFVEKLYRSEATTKEEGVKAKADAIDAYFASHGLPLAGAGMKMVIEAEKNNLDWRLVPALAMRESTGGKFACKRATHNPFGWGSCRINFSSNDHAIETVARNLGGNNPRTAYHYAGKTLRGILNAYNPPSIVPRYADQVMAIMADIEENLSSRHVASAI